MRMRAGLGCLPPIAPTWRLETTRAISLRSHSVDAFLCPDSHLTSFALMVSYLQIGAMDGGQSRPTSKYMTASIVD